VSAFVLCLFPVYYSAAIDHGDAAMPYFIVEGESMTRAIATLALSFLACTLQSDKSLAQTMYCAQLLEYQMYSNGTTYYYYRCQQCSSDSAVDCTYVDLCTTQAQTTGQLCVDCGGTCTGFTVGSHSVLTRSKSSSQDVPDLLVVDEVGVQNMKFVDYASWVSPWPNNQLAVHEFKLKLTGNKSFRCVEVQLPYGAPPLRVGLQIDSSSNYADPPSGLNAPICKAQHNGYEANDKRHHLIEIIDSGDKYNGKKFHVISAEDI
jgi:hypothetical protein